MDGDFHNVFRTEGVIQRREAAISDRERLTAELAATMMGRDWKKGTLADLDRKIDCVVDVANKIIDCVQGVPF